MQGVAPFVQKHLSETYNIKTVNLSKQSTGLTYTKLFNWPKTIKDTIQANPNIKALVLFLGPNDPWDMQDPKTHHHLTFATPEWDTEYRSRMKNIIDTAQKHHVQVLWLTPPNMQKEPLNQKMIYLNELMQKEIQANHETFVDTRPLISGQNNHFKESLNGTKMRTADGIHFTAEGQRLLANYIFQQFKMAQ